MEELESDLPDVGTNDADALENGKEDGCFEIGSSRQANGHKGSTRAEVVNGLGVTRGACGGDNRGVSTQPTCDTLDDRNEVLSFFKIYPSLSTEAENKVFLIFSGICTQTRAR